MSNKVLFITVSDHWYFPGTLAVVNSIKLFHPTADIAVASSGIYNKALNDVQKNILLSAGCKVYDHSHFSQPGRILGAWQLKAYMALDLCSDYDVVIGIDSDAVLCSDISDIINKTLSDNKWRGGKDGTGVEYTEKYKNYGINTPVFNPKYMSTSLYIFKVCERNLSILKEWCEYTNEADYGPQPEKKYPGHGDQGVLNAILFKNNLTDEIDLLDNNIFSQHSSYEKDVISFDNGKFINHSHNKTEQRMFHATLVPKFWDKKHSELVRKNFHLTWNYSWWLAMLFFGPATPQHIDPFRWISNASYHLLQDAVEFFHKMAAVYHPCDGKWSLLSNEYLSRMTEGLHRMMSIGSSMTQYIEIAKTLFIDDQQKIIVEVGSYLGGSCVTLAIGLLNKPVIVYSVESFTGDLNGKVDNLGLPSYKNYVEQTRLKYPNLPIIPISLDSKNSSKLFAEKSVDMVFIDAGHSTESVLNDIDFWLNKIKPGGIIAGDDIGWESVKNAVKQKFPNFSEAHGIWWQQL